jgi:branched-chain amino acid aminotransferase
MIVWHNGQFIEDSQPVLTASDRALLGDGVFDTLLSIDGAPEHGPEHMERLLKHASVLDISPPYTPGELLVYINETLERNGITSGFHAVKTVITMGPGGRGPDMPVNPEPNCIVTVSPVPDPAELPAISAVLAKQVRRNEHSPLSRIKSLSCADNRLARQEAKSRGTDDAILLNTSGNLACAAAGNVFVETDTGIFTPPLTDGAMDGITRRHILDRGLATERTIAAEELLRCKGLWITNSIQGIRVVCNLENRKIDSRKLATGI